MSKKPDFQLQGAWKEDRKWFRGMRHLKKNIKIQLSRKGRWIVDCDDSKNSRQGALSLSSQSVSGFGNSGEEWQRRGGNSNVVVENLLNENPENLSRSAYSNQEIAVNRRTSVGRAREAAALSSDTNLAKVSNNGRNIQDKKRIIRKKRVNRRKMWKGHERPLMLQQFEV